MANIARYTDALWNLDTTYYFNDFPNYTTATDGVSSFNQTGTTAVSTTLRGGQVVLTTGAAQNQSASIYNTTGQWLFAAGKPIYGRTSIQYAEANTNDAGAFVGFLSAPVAATTLADSTGAMRTTGTLAGLYKLPDTLVWRAVSRNGTEVNDTATLLTAGSASYQTIEITIADWDQVSVMITYKVNGDYVKDANNAVIRDRLLIASAVIMSFGATIKAPLAAGTSEVLNMDYMYAHQLR